MMHGIDKTVFFAIYTRQSVESRLEMNSCQAQFDLCMNCAQEHFPEAQWIGQRFDDEGLSGYTLERPALERLRKVVAEGKITYVLITYLDRLSRNLIDSAVLLNEFQSAGIQLQVVKLPELNTRADGQFLCNILMSFAEFERDIIRERIAEARAYLKKHGRRLAGRIPFGYDADQATKQLVINKKEAMQVETIFAIAFDGKTPAEIAQIINEKGCRTKRHAAKSSGNVSGGSRWSPRQIAALLRNPVYIGMFQDGHSIRQGSHEAIIHPATYAEIQRKMDARRTKKEYGKRYNIQFPLRGKIICPGCGRKLTTDTGHRKLDNGKLCSVIYRYYRCRSTAGGKPPCKGIRYSAYELEQCLCDRIGESKFWQRFTHYHPDKAKALSEIHSVWVTLDLPTQFRYMAMIVEEVRLTPKGGMTVTFFPDFFKKLPLCEKPSTDSK